MSTPSQTPRRRHARDGRAHLTLVSSQDGPATPAAPADDDEHQPDIQADTTRRLLMSGSATVRALIALGALVTALGLVSAAKSMALEGHEHAPEAANPDRPTADTDAPAPHPPNTAPAPAAPAVPVVPASKTASTPQTVPATVKSPTHQPGATDGQSVPIKYTMPGPAPTGKHRRPHGGHEEHHDGHGHGNGHGRHRRGDHHDHEHEHGRGGHDHDHRHAGGHDDGGVMPLAGDCSGHVRDAAPPRTPAPNAPAGPRGSFYEAADLTSSAW
jgi:hypothetical protein